MRRGYLKGPTGKKGDKWNYSPKGKLNTLPQVIQDTLWSLWNLLLSHRVMLLPYDLTLPIPWPCLGSEQKVPLPHYFSGSKLQHFRNKVWFDTQDNKNKGRMYLEKLTTNLLLLFQDRLALQINVPPYFSIATVTAGCKSFISHFIGKNERLITQPTSLRWLWSLLWILNDQRAWKKMHMNKYWNVYERYLWKILRPLCLNMHI